MAGDLNIDINGTKADKYTALYKALQALTIGEADQIADMANIAAGINEVFGFLWTGFYRVRGNELVLGPFQGPVACTRIKYGKGVCGEAWSRAETLIVPDVERFPGHIACSSRSKSEIVVPVFKDGEVVAVLDIDSCELNTFDETDAKFLEDIVKLLT